MFKKSGFTVIELLIVVMIIVIMALIAVPGWRRATTRYCVFTANDKLGWHVVKMERTRGNPVRFVLEDGSKVILEEAHIFKSKKCPSQDIHKWKGE